jgi:hypothetical protein
MSISPFTLKNKPNLQCWFYTDWVLLLKFCHSFLPFDSFKFIENKRPDPNQFSQSHSYCLPLLSSTASFPATLFIYMTLNFKHNLYILHGNSQLAIPLHWFFSSIFVLIKTFPFGADLPHVTNISYEMPSVNRWRDNCLLNGRSGREHAGNGIFYFSFENKERRCNKLYR